ncbi:ATP-grasp domain-containing protein [bacterium]|nr:ATP-grasp domain-containing protein [bacterium]
MTQNSPTILFISPNWENHSLIKSLCNNGIKVIGYGNSLDRKNASLQSYRHINGNIQDYTSLYDICNLYNVDSIISDNCDYSLLVAERLSSMLNLPSTGVRSAEISNNKLKQRELAQKSNINQPQYCACNSTVDVVRFIESIESDVLIKPLDSRGSMGISYLTRSSTNEEIARAICVCLSASPSGKFLVEEYIHGELYTIDGFMANDGLYLVGLASRERSGRGETVTRQILYKSSFSSSFLDISYNFLSTIKDAFGYFSGHIHCEALLDSSGKFCLVECTNRGAGVFTSSSINPYISGIDLNLEYLRLKAKTQLSSNLKESKHIIANKNDASLLFPSLGKEGEILERFDVESILKIDLVLDVQLFTAIGRPLSTSIDGPTRHFGIALKTSNNEEIASTIEYIRTNFVTLS